MSRAGPVGLARSDGKRGRELKLFAKCMFFAMSVLKHRIRPRTAPHLEPFESVLPFLFQEQQFAS